MLRLLSASLLAGLVTITLFSATSHADDKCTIAVKGDSPVAKACKEANGIKRAKATMKAMQKVGKDKGLKFECDDCHKDESAGNWSLNKDAEEKFKKLLAAQGG
jgi:redox-regulated HSP33 family molecular chaperone